MANRQEGRREVTIEKRGVSENGRELVSYALKGAGGMEMEVFNFGCKVNRLAVPDRNGRLEDVAVSFDPKKVMFGGSVVGRYANRIAHGRFAVDGTEYAIPTNTAPGGVPCLLHGGPEGFHAQAWTVEPFERGGDVGLAMSYLSPDGEGGFPGEVKMSLTYTLTADNVWRLEYAAETDRPTPLNLTHHIYFNLSGERRAPVTNQIVTLAASAYTPVGPDMIPTGELRDVTGTDFDFRKPTAVGARMDGAYDHNYCLDSKDGSLAFAAKVEDPASGRTLETWTTEPGLQLYTGGSFSEKFSDQYGRPLYRFCGLALESQKYPDSVNQKGFPDSILRPGQTFRSVTEYRFS